MTSTPEEGKSGAIIVTGDPVAVYSIGAELEQPANAPEESKTAAAPAGKKAPKKKRAPSKKKVNTTEGDSKQDGSAEQSKSARPNKRKRQKKDKDLPKVDADNPETLPQLDSAAKIAQHSTKSTIGPIHDAPEESKISSVDPTAAPAAAGGKKKKAARNRTKAQPVAAFTADDYVEGSDDEDLQEALKLTMMQESAEGKESKSGSAAGVEESELYLADQDMAAALDLSDSETVPVAAQAAAAEESEEEVKRPEKVQKKKPAPAAKKEATKKASKTQAKGKDEVGGNKHAKAQPTKVMMTEKEAKVAVAEYMQQQNRPYSLQNVMDNLHGRIARKICQQVLDDLTDEKHLVCKEFGKAKIYMPNQDNFPETSKEDLNELDSQIAEKRQTLDEQKEQIKQLQAELKTLSGSLTNESFITSIGRLKEENSEAEGRLKMYQEGGMVMVTEEEVNEVKTDFTKYHKFWRERRRACIEIVDMICESVDQNRKEFFEQVGLETDEEYGASLAEIVNEVDL